MSRDCTLANVDSSRNSSICGENRTEFRLSSNVENFYCRDCTEYACAIASDKDYAWFNGLRYG